MIRMSKRKKRVEGPRPSAAEPAGTESQSIEILTVGWMLSVLTTFVCEVGFAAARGYLLAIDSGAAWIQLLAVVLFFASLVVGLASLGLGLAVVKNRQTPPPRGIVVFSLVVGAAPLATMLLRVMMLLAS